VRSLKILIPGIILLVLQVTVLQLIRVYHAVPDLLIIYLVFVALKYGSMHAVVFGFIIGMMQDVYNYPTLGATALANTVVGFIVGIFQEQFIRLDIISKILMLALAFVLRDVIYSMAIQLNSETILSVLKSRSLPHGIYTLIVGTLFFYINRSHRHKNV
jgi:rod shape-determining protein MreD